MVTTGGTAAAFRCPRAACRRRFAISSSSRPPGLGRPSVLRLGWLLPYAAQELGVRVAGDFLERPLQGRRRNGELARDRVQERPPLQDNVGVGVIVLLELGAVAGYLAMAGFIAVVGAAAALLLPDPPAPAESAAARQQRSLSDRLAALRHRDFAWLLGGRLVVNIGNALGTGLLFFFLLYGLDRDPASAEDDLLLLIVIYTVFVVASSIVSGMVSDRTGRRVGIVLWSAILQGLAALFIALVPTFETTMIGAALLGIGYGAYMSVGLALGTDVLPYPEDHARDLGFVNVSASLGQLLGPLIGAGLVALVGGFSLMFAVGGVLSIVGGVMTLGIRRRARASSAV